MSLRSPRFPFSSGLALILALIYLSVPQLLDAQTPSSNPQPSLPEAPQPQPSAQTTAKTQAPCKPKAPGAQAPSLPQASEPQPAQPCHETPVINWFDRFLNGPEVKALTPAQKARLAARNVIDPFNAVTILGTSAISVAADAHSAYGPGMTGFGRYVGVSYAQDVTGEFFGTFLIPSIVHQDPHYHRMPSASVPRRFRHAVAQIFWTKADDGSNMVNYANLVGFAIDGAICNAYVPGQDTSFSASATRYALGLATAPADNLITEFLPDLARRIHVRVVIIQRIINQAARTESSGP